MKILEQDSPVSDENHKMLFTDLAALMGIVVPPYSLLCKKTKLDIGGRCHSCERYTLTGGNIFAKTSA